MLEKPLPREDLKQGPIIKDLNCNSSAERYKLQDYTTAVATYAKVESIAIAYPLINLKQAVDLFWLQRVNRGINLIF